MYTILWVMVLISINAYASEIDQKERDLIFIREHVDATCKSIRPLLGGLTDARLYEIESDEHKPRIIRFLSGFSPELEQKEIELKVMRAAEEATVGPKLFDANVTTDNNNSYIVMKKINCIAPREVLWNDVSTYAKLGTFLKNMHDQPSKISDISGEERLYRASRIFMDRILSKCKEEALPNADNLSHLFDLVKTYLDTAQKIVPTYNRTCLTHGDLHPGNLLCEKNKNGTLKRFVAIDWDHSRFHTDPYFDTGLVLNFYVPKKFKHDFMQAYTNNVSLSHRQKAHLHVMQSVASCYFGLAYACSDPLTFANEIVDRKEHKDYSVGHRVREIMHNGFARSTCKDCGIFGALLFRRVYKSIENKKFDTWIQILQNDDSNTEV